MNKKALISIIIAIVAFAAGAFAYQYFTKPENKNLSQQQIDDVNTATLTTLAPTGAINGSNTVFVFSSPPNIIVTDGKVLQKTASDATANWTGTTTVTLTIAPEFDIFGL